MALSRVPETETMVQVEIVSSWCQVRQPFRHTLEFYYSITSSEDPRRGSQARESLG